jgi:hypothetical protein
MGGIGLPISKEFKYLDVVFDRGLTWNRYVLKRCKTRINFMKSIAGTAWGSHLDNMLILLILYKGLVRSVLEYGCVCFSEMDSVIHIKKLKRVQWRALRISLGLLQSTYTGTVKVLSGVPPLNLRFSYLNRIFLISAFSKGSDTLRGRLQTLADLGSGKMMREFRDLCSWSAGFWISPPGTIWCVYCGDYCVAFRLALRGIWSTG